MDADKERMVYVWNKTTKRQFIKYAKLMKHLRWEFAQDGIRNFVLVCRECLECRTIIYFSNDNTAGSEDFKNSWDGFIDKYVCFSLIKNPHILYPFWKESKREFEGDRCSFHFWARPLCKYPIAKGL